MRHRAHVLPYRIGKTALPASSATSWAGRCVPEPPKQDGFTGDPSFGQVFFCHCAAGPTAAGS